MSMNLRYPEFYLFLTPRGSTIAPRYLRFDWTALFGKLASDWSVEMVGVHGYCITGVPPFCPWTPGKFLVLNKS